MMAQQDPITFYSIIFGIGLSAFFFLLGGIPFVKLAQGLVRLPTHYVIASIGILAIFGTYLIKNNVFFAFLTVVIGLIIIVLEALNISPAPMLIGFVLGPIIETDLIRAYQIGGYHRFLEKGSPVLITIILLNIVYAFYKNMRGRKKPNVDPIDALLEAENNKSDIPKDLLVGILALLATIGILLITRNYKPFFAVLWPWFTAILMLGIDVYKRQRYRYQSQHLFPLLLFL